MNCWSHRPRSSCTSHSIDKPLFIRWWPGLFVFTIWSATELKTKYLGEGSHLDPPNIYTMVAPLVVRQLCCQNSLQRVIAHSSHLTSGEWRVKPEHPRMISTVGPSSTRKVMVSSCRHPTQFQRVSSVFYSPMPQQISLNGFDSELLGMVSSGQVKTA